MKRLLLLALAALSSVAGVLAQPVSATITPISANYSSGAGTIAFAVEISFPASAPYGALSLQVGGLPVGWSFGGVSGDNIPEVRPLRGTTGKFDFAFTNAPGSNPALFTFTAEHAPTTGTQTFSAVKVTFREAGGAVQDVTSPNFSVNLLAGLPAISTQPESNALFTTQSVTLSVTAPGVTSYQWSRNGVPIANATNTTLVFNSLTTSNAAAYTVDLTNASGTTTSTAALLTVTTPSVSRAPATEIVSLGSTVTYTASGLGTGSPTLQWTKDGAPIAGATGVTYAITEATGAEAGAYRIAATNSRGTVTSAAVALAFSPGIGGISPTSGGQGAVVTINGSGFTGASAVRFNGVAASSFTIVSNNQITAVVPTFATSGPITVTLADASVATSATNFTVLEGPRLVNMSQRSASTGGESAVLQSFSIHGTTAKPVLIRAAGPALGSFGITGFMADPFLSIYDGSGTQIGSNNDWDASVASASAGAGAFAFATGSKDAAILMTLPPGTYTARVTGVGGTTGVVLIETYETDATKRISYMSNRSQVGTGPDIKVTGFFLGGAGTTGNKTVLIRAVGTGLGVPGSLLNPTLSVFSGSTTVAVNDNWGSSANVAEINAATAAVGAMPLGANDAAVLLSLPAGGYTVQVSGVGNTTGIALTEVFLVDSFLPPTLPPALLAPLHAQAIDLNGTLTLAAPFISKPAPAFQWQRNGADLATQTASTLSIPGFTGANAGNYRVVFNPAAGAGAVASAVAAVTINKASPNLQWNTPLPITYGTPLAAPPVSGATLNATAAVPGTFVYTPPAGTILNAGAGQILSVTFTPDDSASYNTVTTAVSLTVNKATPTVTWTAPAAIPFGTPLSATQLAAQSPVAGTFAYTPVAGTVLNAGAGQTLSVTFTPTDTNNYNTATRTTTLTVDRATPVVTWNAPADITYGTPLSATQLNAQSPVAGTFSYNPAAGAVLNAGTNQTLSVTFTPTDTANYTSATATTTLNVGKATPVVSWSAPAAITLGTPLSGTQLNASSGGVAGAFVYNPAAGTVLPVGAGQTLGVTFNPADTNNYNSATGSTTITVNKATPTIAWSTPAAITYGTALSATQLNANSPVAGTFTYNPPAGTILNAGANQTLSVAFTPTDGASYNATTATITITVNQATPTVGWSAPADIVYPTALGATQLNATASVPGTFVYNPAAGTVLEPGTAQPLAVTFTPTDAVNYTPATGSTTINVAKATATVTLTNLTHIYNGALKGAGADTVPSPLNVSFTYTGTASPTTAPINVGDYGVTATVVDSRYQGSATGTIRISKADQSISFAGPLSRSLDSGTLTLNATASSNLGITYSLSNPSAGTVATVNGNIITLVNTGTITVTASQGGDSNYNPATAVSHVLTVTAQSQTLTFAQTQLPNKTFEDAPFSISASSNRNLLVTFTTSNPAVAIVGPGTLVGAVTTATVTIMGAGEATITATQAGNVDTGSADDVPRTLTVAKKAATVTLGNLAQTYDNSPRAATAVTNPPGLNVAFTYTPTGGTASPTVPTAAGSYAVTATITGATPPESNYVGSATGTLVIAKATQTITFANILSPKFVNAGSFSLTATSDATPTLPVTFTSSNPSVASIVGNVVTIHTLGTTTITAKQAGDTNYLPAADVAQTLEVRPVAPVITAHPPLAQTIVVGDTFSFGPVTMNAFSSPVTFTLSGTLPAGLTASSVNSTTGAISGIVTATPGVYPFTLTATNATAPADSKTIVLTVNPPAPVFTSPASVSGTVAASFTYTAVATHAASYTLTGALPTGLTFTNGVISGTPGNSSAGTYPVTITATNVTGSASLSLVLRIFANPNSPVITSASLVNGQVNAVLNYQLVASIPAGSGGGTVTYAVVGALPSGVTLNPTSGVVSGTPAVGSAGSYPVHFVATNTNGTGLPLQVTFVIAPAQGVPVVTSNGSASASLGQSFTYNITASNGPITGYAATGLPPGLTLDTAAGAITGTPTAETPAGSPTVVTLTATNATGTSAAKPLLISVGVAPGTPVITSALSANARVGLAFTYTISASATPTSYTATGLPPGLSLTGAVISGTPTQADSFDVTLRAINAVGTGAAATLVLNIVPAATAPTITSPAGASGTVGASFNYAIVATPAPIAVYAVTGTLPLGLSLNATSGVISGTPSAHGISTVDITAGGPGGTSLPQPLVINIAPSASVPGITSPGTASGRVGEAFTYTITATNVGTAPYAPSVVLEAINLPPGLAGNPSTGVIQGTPTTVGVTTASLVGTNANGTGASRALTITIDPAATAPVIVGSNLAFAQVGAPFTYAITVSPAAAATRFEAIGAPAWLSLNTSTGALTGTPTAGGMIPVQLIAFNSAGAGSPFPLVLNVAAAAGSPVVTSARTATGTVGALFGGYTIVASGTGGAVTSYVAVGLPPGLTLNPATGAVTGTPTSSGTYLVNVSANNAAGAGAAVVVTFTIARSVTFGL